jgi:hypothetical protein
MPMPRQPKTKEEIEKAEEKRLEDKYRGDCENEVL